MGQLTPTKNKFRNLAFRDAQSTPPNNLYSFTTFTDTYQPIVGASVSGGLQWDELDFAVPIGFNFKLYGKQNDSIRVFGGSVVTFDDLNNSSAIAAASPVYEDLCDRAWSSTSFEGATGGLSDISYTVTGNTGSRICVIQISNAGFRGEIDSAGISSSFVNFQVWLYETSNKVEFRFGNCNILNPNINLSNSSAGFICGMANITNTSAFTGSGNLLKGPNNSPVMVGFDPNNPFADAVSYQIQSGQVYQFNNTSYNGTGLPKQEGANAISLFPNPAKNLLQVKHHGILTEELAVLLSDINGKLILEAFGNDLISLDGVAPGVYLCRVSGKVASFTTRLVVE